MVGGSGSARSKHAWAQVYRALEHGPAKEKCKNNKIMKQFPKEIEDFANAFVKMQAKRHAADYDPWAKFYKSAVRQDILDAETVIRRFASTQPKDRRAFAAFVLFKSRP